MSVKLLIAVIAVAGLLFLGTAVYAHGPGMGWGYGGHMFSGWGHNMGYNGYGHHMGYGYQQNNGVCYQQGQADDDDYGPRRGPGYHRGQMPYGWSNDNGSW